MQQHHFKGFSLTGSEDFLLQLRRQQSAERSQQRARMIRKHGTVRP